MQVSQPYTIKEKIKDVTLKYLAQADLWGTVAIMQDHTEKLFDHLYDMLPVKCRCKKSKIRALI
jgi:hypothetical protein